MFTFLATILIVYLVWLLVKPLLVAYMRRKYTQRINDMFGQAFGTPPPGSDDRRRREYPSGGGYTGYAQRMKRKIFSRDEGEYVDFEEIDEKVDYYSAEESGNKKYSPREPQVSDAEWEDIK